MKQFSISADDNACHEDYGLDASWLLWSLTAPGNLQSLTVKGFGWPKSAFGRGEDGGRDS